jgi:hypothetical protein
LREGNVPPGVPQFLAVGTWLRSFLPAFSKRVLSKGRRHPKPELCETIEFRSHPLKMLASFCFDEDSDCANTAQAKAGCPSAGRAVVQNNEGILQAAGQVKRAAFSRAKFGVDVIRGSLSDFDPRLAQIRNMSCTYPAALKLLLYLEGDDDLAKQQRQQFNTSQPVQIDKRRRI